MIKWQDKVPDTGVLTRANIPTVHTLLMGSQIRWAGHVARMFDERVPKQVLYGELAEGKRPHGGQKDCFKVSLKSFHIDSTSWETLAQDRSCWRGLISKGSRISEEKRTAEAQRKREQRKSRATSNSGHSTHTHLLLVW